MRAFLHGSTLGTEERRSSVRTLGRLTRAVIFGPTCLAAVFIIAVASPMQAQQRVDLRRAAAPDISLRIQGNYASLKVVAWSEDSVVVTGQLPKGFRLEGGFGGADGTPSRGGKLFVEGPTPMGPSSGSLEVRVPLRTKLWAKASSATIDVSGVTGGLDLNVVSGSVTVTGNPSELSIESMDGNVTVTGSPAWTRLKTAAGDIVVRGGSGDAAFTTVSGNIHVGGGPLDRARFESVTGGIEFTGDVARGAAISVDTHSGAIDLQLDPKVSVELDAASVAGSIENRLSRKQAEPGRDGRGATLITSYGPGGAHLVVRTYKGSIRLSSR
ncbi:MAG: DUF4097 family beta strand repeat-containing protein [Gemmatimonadaceae bacterium]